MPLRLIPHTLSCSWAQLKLRPENFVRHLTNEVGFTLVASLNQGTQKGFDRPLHVFQRPEAGGASEGAAGEGKAVTQAAVTASG